MSIGTISIGRVYKNTPNKVNIRIDRGTPLGNKYYMPDESQRDRVCDQYTVWFERNRNEPEQRKELVRIYNILKSGKDVNLQCWCSPKRCHGETIKAFLEKYL